MIFRCPDVVNLSDFAVVTKSVTNPVNREYKDPCRSLIYRGLAIWECGAK